MNWLTNLYAEPVKLQVYLWFSFCFHIGRLGREGWRELKKEHFTTKVNAESKWYYTIVTERTDDHVGGNNQADQDYSDVRM